MHMTPTTLEVEVIETTSFMVIVVSTRNRACKLPNVKGKLNSKRNDTLSKHIACFWNKFVNVYESLEETALLIAKKHLALATQLYCENRLA